MEKHSLAQELEIRHDVAIKVKGLVAELNRTIEFAQHKLEFMAKSHFINKDYLFPLLDLLTEEIENSCRTINKLKEIKRSAILPLPEIEKMNVAGCMEITNAIDDILQNGEINKEKETFKSQVALMRLREVQYEKIKEPDDELTVAEFSKMRQRYAVDQTRKHEIMREETCSPKDSFRDLINTSRNIPQIMLWNENDHDLLKTIAEMRERKMMENDLLPLIDYLDKYDFLKKMMDDEEPAKKTKCKMGRLKKRYEGVLSSEEAEHYWKRLRKAKIVDSNNQPNGLSWSESGYLASVMANKLGIKNLWKEFGVYWNLDKDALRSGYNKGFGYATVGDFMDKMKDIFS